VPPLLVVGRGAGGEGRQSVQWHRLPLNAVPDAQAVGVRIVPAIPDLRPCWLPARVGVERLHLEVAPVDADLTYFPDDASHASPSTYIVSTRSWSNVACESPRG